MYEKNRDKRSFNEEKTIYMIDIDEYVNLQGTV